MATIKGENLRILIGPDAEHLKCIAAATSCVIHLKAEVQEDTTKDTVDDWIVNEVVGLNWDAQVDALVITDNTETGAILADALQCGLEYTLMFSQTATTAGTKNRNPISNAIQYIGKAILNDLTFNAPNQDVSNAMAKFIGSQDITHYN